ncbi:TraR/DksA family transcriptional regulator [Marinifilum sp. N1E240]|uniref:TraR/DksA family transcriptional regulator n=1 Tax=Marinifilum sp. N1E240 TaxID=2608082 RepID=UPI00128BB752|nr:TraR/DksA C4-type zinc finger protein [Marinifilum sp. N1E240]MPQ48034.1 TraR/DksA family transcriptional regulator [Marinifilum sp. N1E240]|eukprot:TRINITY_DN21955_c0_g2_i1.p1 TRINITY_DN21955_c0_g2~~TRINITY_DN21955_c0_g2_i1.p1  ORF type:complete len:133 (+),score=28.58 TRINITY_DN21955_c0_g2_i1:25-399(+)
MTDKKRYTDEELQEFKDLIQSKLAKAKKDFDTLKAVISNSSGNDIEDTSPTFKVLEEGASVLSKEEAGRLAQRQAKFISHLEGALIRIENKTYGICRETGKLIGKERLRAVPHATLSIEAKNKQ